MHGSFFPQKNVRIIHFSKRSPILWAMWSLLTIKQMSANIIVPVTIKCDIIDFTAWLFEVHKLDDMVGIKCGMWMSTAVFVTTQLNLVVRRFGCMKWMPHPVMFMLELNTTLQKSKLNWSRQKFWLYYQNGLNQGISNKSQSLIETKQDFEFLVCPKMWLSNHYI